MSQKPTLETVRTVENGRLLWWRQEADDEYWRQRFEPTIASTHAAAATDRLGALGDILSRHLPRDGKVLEAGCGTGWLVAGLRSRGLDIEGVEASRPLIEEVQRQYPDLPVRGGDVTRLEVEDGHYRGYVSIGVIEHFRDGCDHFLKEACRVTAPGGILCVSVPHFNFVRRMKARLGRFSADPGELPFYQYAFTRNDFQELFRDFPVTVVSVAAYGMSRGFQEELPKVYERVSRTRLLWRLPRLLDHFNWTGLSTHMIMLVLRRH